MTLPVADDDARVPELWTLAAAPQDAAPPDLWTLAAAPPDLWTFAAAPPEAEIEGQTPRAALPAATPSTHARTAGPRSDLGRRSELGGPPHLTAPSSGVAVSRSDEAAAEEAATTRYYL